MKKIFSLLLAICMMLSLLAGCGAPQQPAADADGLTVNVSVPEDFEGELNGRLLFVLDNSSFTAGKARNFHFKHSDHSLAQ